jgi:carboxyl-terminal processing protease
MGKRETRNRVWQSLAILVALSFYPFPLSPVTLSAFPSAHAERTDAAIVSTATREGRLAVFDDAWSTINSRYYDPEFHGLARGLDWNAQRIIFRSLAAEANSSQELYAVLRRMIASLNDPHTRIYPPEEKFDWWRPRFVSIGIVVREIGGLPTVVQVERDSAPQRDGVRAGDVIETVDGTPALSLINRRLDNSTVSPNLSTRLRAFAKLFEGPAGTLVDVGWKRKDGSDRSAQFRRYWQQRDLGLRIRRENDDYAILEMDGFTKAIAADFARGLAEKISGARGVIIDLRGNGGGDAEAMSDIASAFLGDGFNLGQFTDRNGSSFTIITRSRSLFMAERIAQTKLPLVVLTSERTSSAAEIFIAALKAARRATIIGTETCGCVLAIRTRHTLPDGGGLDISEFDYETATGARLEGHGVKPDETVVVERNDLYAGRDRAMDLAVNKLTRLEASVH